MALNKITIRSIKKIWNEADDDYLFNTNETALLCKLSPSTLCVARKKGGYIPFEKMIQEKTNKNIFVYRKKNISKFLADTGRIVCKGKIDPREAYNKRLMRIRLAALRKLGI